MLKRLLKIFLVFMKIGALTIGGGYAMVPIMREDFCVKLRWISDEDMADVLGLAQSAPGILAANTASLIGYRLAGVWGATVGVLGAILPSFIIILIIAVIFPGIAGNPYVQKALLGAQAAITATIISYAIKSGKLILKDVFSVLIMIVALVAGAVFRVNLFYIIIAGGVAGLVYYSIRRAQDVSDN